MNIKHLQALVGIAESGSFSGAATSMGTVQSNVSAHIARLERELDAVLVDRATCRLTEEGQVVLARARRILGELDALVADVGAMQHDVSGTAHIGTIGTAGRWLVPLLVEHLREAYPQVTVTITDSTSTTLEPLLEAGQIELAIITMPVNSEELSSSPLFEEDLVLVLPRDHELAQDGLPVAIATLASLTLLLPLPGTPLRDEIEAAVRPSGVTLKASMEMDGIWIISALTFDGYGPSILPSTAVPPDMRDRFAIRPLEEGPRRRVGIALRSRGHPSALTRVLIDLLYTLLLDPSHVPAGVHPTMLHRPRK